MKSAGAKDLVYFIRFLTDHSLSFDSHLKAYMLLFDNIFDVHEHILHKIFKTHQIVAGISPKLAVMVQNSQ